MRIPHHFPMRIPCALLMSITSALYGLPAQAWQVDLETQDQVKQVVVSNELNLNDSDAYLVFFDQDNPQEMFTSWTLQEGWQKGLKPVSKEAMMLTPFGPKVLTTLDQTCPPEHRCFLALVAVPQGTDPLLGQWQASSLLPLTAAAGRERYPGQRFFLSQDSTVYRFNGAEGMAPTATTASPEEAAAPSKISADSGAIGIEKPDLFKLEGDQLLYANGQAQRFQVIDLKDPKEPKLVAWTPLKGMPREIYVLGNNYILLQTDYSNHQEGTHITVLQKGSLALVQELTLPGQFVESRRRGNIIYAVTQKYNEVTIMEESATKPACIDCGVSPLSLSIDVLRMREDGSLEKMDPVQLTGYSPITAIFPDHLVIANPDPQKWPASQVQVFDLRDVNNPLVKLPLIEVPGRIPSEFHLHVQEGQLRVAYGPAEIKEGSALAIYDLNAPTPTLMGKVDKIAPGEDLFATRFAGNFAYMVTYERKDPLWVIDLSDPKIPTIKGELVVPGWSEKLFFHDNQLFAVGIYDQPEQPDRWIRQVAISLFDVTEPTKPALLERFIPLKETDYSWSPALDEERALFLDWDQTLAALPIESWDTQARSYLQILSFANKDLKDEGLVSSPVSLQRSLSIAPDILAALADQALLTVKWGNDQAQVLGELELAANLAWLKYQAGHLLAATMGNNGYHRLYRYAPTDLETPTQRWSLSKGYGGIEVEGNLAVFYDYNPLAIQVVELDTGKIREAQVLEVVKEVVPVPEVAAAETEKKEGDVVTEAETVDTTEPEKTEDAAIEPVVIDIVPPWYDRTSPMISQGWLYVAEQQPLPRKMLENLIIPDNEMVVNGYQQNQWVLRSWELKSGETKEDVSRSIPGRPLMFTKQGELVTQETSETGSIRLNLLALETNNARLVQSNEVPCQGGYSSQVFADEGQLYATCVTEIKYILPPSDTDPKEATTFVKLDPNQGFAEQGRWTLNKYWNLQAVGADVVMISEGWRYYGPWLDIGIKDSSASKMSILPPYYQTGCDLYRFTPGADPVLLKHLETCYYQETTALTSEKGWVAKGFAGIEAVQW